MMDCRRLAAEVSVLESRLSPQLFRFFRPLEAGGHLVVAARTNRGNVYTVRIELDLFPCAIPKVFIVKMLKDSKGRKLDAPCAAMHTLQSENGWTRICHYGVSSWKPNVALFKVFVKARLWLEMYELHLQTGLPIDHYLNHQK